MSETHKYAELLKSLEELLAENNRTIEILSGWVDKLETKLSDTEEQLEKFKRGLQGKEGNENE